MNGVYLGLVHPTSPLAASLTAGCIFLEESDSKYSRWNVKILPPACRYILLISAKTPRFLPVYFANPLPEQFANSHWINGR